MMKKIKEEIANCDPLPASAEEFFQIRIFLIQKYLVNHM